MGAGSALQAIYLGAVPIIQRSPLDLLYEGLPVLFVDDFSKVNSSLLESYAAKRSVNAQYDTAKAWSIYWHRELQHRQHLLCGRQAYPASA